MSNQRVEIRTVHSLTDGEAIQLMREIERLYLQMAPKQMSFMVPAEPEGTEHYADVWQIARSMGYANVTDALVELERMKAAPPAAAHGDEAVRKLVLPTPEQVMDVVMRFQWEDRKNGTGTTNWAANLGMTVVEYVARLNADAAGGPAVSLADAEHWTEREVAEFLAIALRHVTVKGSLDPQDIRDAFRVMREQAAMRAQGDGGEA